MFFFYPVSRHQCSPVKTKEITKVRYSHCQHYAAYDKIEYVVDIAECPVCNKTYEYNQQDDKFVARIPYSELVDLKGKL